MPGRRGYDGESGRQGTPGDVGPDGGPVSVWRSHDCILATTADEDIIIMLKFLTAGCPRFQRK